MYTAVFLRPHKARKSGVWKCEIARTAIQNEKGRSLQKRENPRNAGRLYQEEKKTKMRVHLMKSPHYPAKRRFQCSGSNGLGNNK